MANSSPIRTVISPGLETPAFNEIRPIQDNISPLNSPVRYLPLADHGYQEQVIYPLRVPAYEMSYLEYSQMYEHAYRTYYSSSVPLSPPTGYEKVYVYDDRPQFDITVSDKRNYETRLPKYVPITEDEEMPLNLKCTNEKVHRTESFIIRPIEDSMEFQLFKNIDMPLDLSTKSYDKQY